MTVTPTAEGDDTTSFFTNRGSEQVDKLPVWREIWIERLNSPVYNGLLIAINLLAILVSVCKDHNFKYSRFELMNYWRYSTLIVNSVFLVDLIANIVIARP